MDSSDEKNFINFSDKTLSIVGLDVSGLLPFKSCLSELNMLQSFCTMFLRSTMMRASVHAKQFMSGFDELNGNQGISLGSL